MVKLQTAIIGACGEHYAAAFISSQGLIVAMPRGGVPGCDLMVTDIKNGHALRVQVKTGTQTRSKYKGDPIRLWRTSLKVIDYEDKHLWYAHVALNGWPQRACFPEIFFVPSCEVVQRLKGEIDETWPSFWMLETEAGRFGGIRGFDQMRAALNSLTTDTV
jgi:hypothetical protein